MRFTLFGQMAKNASGHVFSKFRAISEFAPLRSRPRNIYGPGQEQAGGSGA